MENRPELEFEHFLAVKLSMTVRELRDRMDNHEFGRWAIYYARIGQRRTLEQGGAGS